MPRADWLWGLLAGVRVTAYGPLGSALVPCRLNRYFTRPSYTHVREHLSCIGKSRY